MKNVLIAGLSLFAATSAFATSSTLKCDDNNGSKTSTVVSIAMDSNNLLASAKGYYVAKGEKPELAFAMKNVGARPGTRNPKTTNMFQVDYGYGEQYTIYMPRNISASRGTTAGIAVLMEMDGVSPQLVKMTCDVK